MCHSFAADTKKKQEYKGLPGKCRSATGFHSLVKGRLIRFKKDDIDVASYALVMVFKSI